MVKSERLGVTEWSRRQFIRQLAGTAGGAAILGLPDGAHVVAQRGEDNDNDDQGERKPSPNTFKHVVLVMMENRSFDHMLGFLPREGHLRSVEGLTGSEYNLADPTNPNSQKFFVSPNACFEMQSVARGVGPPHEFSDVNRQLTNTDEGPSASQPATNNGFVRAWTFSLECYLDLVKDTVPPTAAEMAR